MGAEVSTIKLRAGKSKSVVTNWTRRKLQTQLFGVVRHAERADGPFAFFNGGRWTQTEDFLKWPVDPPLSDGGVEAAQEMALRIRSYVEESGTDIHVVVSSPYCRCIQTAAEICIELGPKVRVLVDRSLGEVYGPAVMGPVEPVQPIRHAEQMLAYCSSRGITCKPRVIGTWPQWPEDLRSGRRRYANRFLAYLNRGENTKRNFLLVTHADCVGAALSMMPSQVGHAIEKIDYGGFFLAQRCLKSKSTLVKQGSKSSLRRKRSIPLPSIGKRGLSSVVPVASTCDETESIEEGDSAYPSTATGEDPSSGGSPGEQWGANEYKELVQPLEEDKQLKPPSDSDGWKVYTEDISLRSCPTEDSAKFNKRVKSLAKNSDFSRELIERLLGGSMPRQSLDERNEDGSSILFISQQLRAQRTMTSCSMSTYLFGGSEVDSIGPSQYASEVSLADLAARCRTLSLTRLSDGSPTSPIRHGHTLTSSPRERCNSMGAGQTRIITWDERFLREQCDEHKPEKTSSVDLLPVRDSMRVGPRQKRAISTGNLWDIMDAGMVPVRRRNTITRRGTKCSSDLSPTVVLEDVNEDEKDAQIAVSDEESPQEQPANTEKKNRFAFARGRGKKPEVRSTSPKDRTSSTSPTVSPKATEEPTLLSQSREPSPRRLQFGRQGPTEVRITSTPETPSKPSSPPFDFTGSSLMKRRAKAGADSANSASSSSTAPSPSMAGKTPEAAESKPPTFDFAQSALMRRRAGQSESSTVQSAGVGVTSLSPSSSSQKQRDAASQRMSKGDAPSKGSGGAQAWQEAIASASHGNGPSKPFNMAASALLRRRSNSTAGSSTTYPSTGSNVESLTSGTAATNGYSNPTDEPDVISLVDSSQESVVPPISSNRCETPSRTSSPSHEKVVKVLEMRDATPEPQLLDLGGSALMRRRGGSPAAITIQSSSSSSGTSSPKRAWASPSQPSQEEPDRRRLETASASPVIAIQPRPEETPSRPIAFKGLESSSLMRRRGVAGLSLRQTDVGTPPAGAPDSAPCERPRVPLVA